MLDIFFTVVSWISTYREEIAAVATAFIAIYTIFLARIGRKQVTLTKLLQRAYLSVDQHGIEPYGTGDEVVPHVGIRNAGHLTASDVRWHICMERHADENFVPPNVEATTGPNVVTPGTTAVPTLCAKRAITP